MNGSDFDNAGGAGKRSSRKKSGWPRRIARWSLGAGLVVLILVSAVVLILAFPQPLFAHKQIYGEFSVYSDAPISSDFEAVAENLRYRVAAMENARPGASCRVFICGNEKLYSLFAFLTRRTSNSLAIGITAFGNVYLNKAKIDRFAAQNFRSIRHCRYEGNYAEVIAHEIAHFNVVKTLGYKKALGMPVWKSEGYAEYQANVAAASADSTYALADRFELLEDDASWSRTAPIARQFFEWHVLVEFLGEVRGIGLTELAEETLTHSAARRDMDSWFRDHGRRSRP